MRKKKEKYEVEQNVQYPQQQYSGIPGVMLAYKLPTCGITPAPRPTTFVQLPPVTMPLSVVPYLTEEQPLAMYDE